MKEQLEGIYGENGQFKPAIGECQVLKHSLFSVVFWFIVNGTTGESLLLTVDERKKLAEKWVQAGKHK